MASAEGVGHRLAAQGDRHDHRRVLAVGLTDPSLRRGSRRHGRRLRRLVRAAPRDAGSRASAAVARGASEARAPMNAAGRAKGALLRHTQHNPGHAARQHLLCCWCSPLCSLWRDQQHDRRPCAARCGCV
ncbi:hypothetical protein J2W32_005505 [Variovorax boronicumulans]|uniref:Uncharacterized protein n=1 Tax=Variovorax boronicumulans TaxID=436515 RepID=A0AAW8D7Q2_9BURK|nr:hypothetical protein [Variovorax boronicumulans]MDQ0056437.1 hypothetical protein [Variovorax boronicumulans]